MKARLLIERTQAGFNRAKAEGKTLGRPATLSDDQRGDVAQRPKDGAGVSALSRIFQTSRPDHHEGQRRRFSRIMRPLTAPALRDIRPAAHPACRCHYVH